MRFLWEQSWKVLDGTVELAEMYSKAISWLPTQECEPLMWEALLLVGAVSLHKPMIALCAAPKKREASSSLSQRQSLALHRARQSGHEQKIWCLQLGTGYAWMPYLAYPAILITTRFIKTFSQEHSLGSC